MEKHDKYRFGTFLFAALFGFSAIFSFFLSPIPVTADCGEGYEYIGESTRLRVLADSNRIYNAVIYNQSESYDGFEYIESVCNYDQNLIDTLVPLHRGESPWL